MAAVTSAKEGNNAPADVQSSLLSRSAQGATFLIILQIGSRALTFAVNQLLLRYLSPESLGISVQLEVYSITVLLFARENLRVAIQRQTDDTHERGNLPASTTQGHVDSVTPAGKTQTVINLSYISIVLGIFFALVLGITYGYSLQANNSEIFHSAYFKEALVIYGFSTIIELLSEPCFVVIQQKSEFKIRAAAESVATVSRCLAICGSTIWASQNRKDLGVMPFALGQLCYGVSLSAVYYGNVWGMATRYAFSLKLSPIFSRIQGGYLLSLFSRQLLALGASLFVQSIIKHVLTQGDTLLIATLASLQAQGTYALASNYGGLVARMVFQPIEESSRSYFAKLLSSVDREPPVSAVTTASKHLHTLLHFYALVSVGVVALGPTIAPQLLEIVAGSRWTSTGAGEVLATYCYYIPLLAINGITEAFISAVATKAELYSQSTWMLSFSIGFASAGFIFLRVLDWGAKGLVWANVINMAVRVIWSTTFISRFLSRKDNALDIAAVMPRLTTLTLGVTTAAISSRVQSEFTVTVMGLLKSGILVACFLVMLALCERSYFLECYRAFKPRTK